MCKGIGRTKDPEEDFQNWAYWPQKRENEIEITGRVISAGMVIIVTCLGKMMLIFGLPKIVSLMALNLNI